MSREIAKKVTADLAARKAGWEDKQRVWYEMRHEGIRRKSKPFAGAADLHYPLGDGMIDKLKPFFWAQVFGNETIATFISESKQDAELTRGAANAFDFHVKEETNFFEEILSNIDNMGMSGGAPVKVWWNAAKGRLEFDAIDPIFFVVPKGTKDLENATRATHVMQMSVEEYKLDDRYDQEEETIRRIKGKGVAENDSAGKTDEKYNREGMTFGDSDDQIVLWEVFERSKTGIRVYTFAPCNPEVPVRKPFDLALPYDRLPFFHFKMEIKDKGYHAPRGIMERIAAHESYLNRLWNEKADSMTFLNKPIFTHDGTALNLQNIRLTPGQVVPNNLRKVDMGKTPFDIDQEMTQTRMTAEYQIGMPDFGIGQNINTKERKTATEVSAMGNLMSQSTDLRAWIFRRDLAKLYRFAWQLLQHFGREKLESYYADNELVAVPEEALAASYRIQPSGTADGWNRAARAARALQRLQAYRGDPSVNQAALTRHALDEDDPRLVKTLWQDPGMAKEGQVEDQAGEIAILQIGFSARVTAADDDQVHLETVFGFVQAQMTMGRPIEPLFAKKLMEHVQKHLQQLHPKNASLANQIGKAAEQLFAPLMQQVQELEQTMQQAGQQPQLPPPPQGQPELMPQQAAA